MPGTSTQGVHTFPRRRFPSRQWPLWRWPAGTEPLPGGGAAGPVEHWAGGGDFTFAPGAGEHVDLLALVPVDEPLSAGPPPVRPSLVRRLLVDFGVRHVRVRAGYLITSSTVTGGAHRVRFVVRWPGITQSERDALRAFFRDEVLVDQQAGGRFGFDLEPDGPGNGTLVVRPVAAVEQVFLGRGHQNVHGVYELEVEELFTPGSGTGGVGSGLGIGDIDIGGDGSLGG